MSPGYPDNIALRQRGLIADSSSAATTPTQTASATAPPTTKPESLEAWGKQLFTQHGCVSCHSNKQVAPLLEGLYGQGARKLASGATVKTDEAYIRESIINPAAKVAAGYPPIMPSFKHLPQEEVDALIAYIKSL
jgi:mono/diheme cytochrome c family protein